MTRYLTITQYKNADTGMSLTGIPDMSLATYIVQAESDIDAFCGFDLRYGGGFEPHSIWTQAQFDSRSLRMQSPNGPVPVRQVLRYRIQVSNLSNTGAGFFANISQNDCAINVFDEYVEIVPLQSITYSLAPVLIQLGLRPPIVQMDVALGYYLASFGEPLYLLSGNTYVALRGFWASTYSQSLATQPNTLPPVPPVVYVNGVAQASNTYTVNYTEGQITFNSSPSGMPTADITYQIPDNVRDATILQTSYLLGKRRLNQQGMQGLGMARSGDVEIRTVESFPARFPTNLGALCEGAANKLSPYIEIPVA